MPSFLSRLRRGNRWEARWRSEDYAPEWLHRGPRPQVCAAAEEGWIAPGASVIDLGCGLGDSVAWLASRGHPALGVDISREAVRRAAELHAGSGAEFRAADVTKPMRGVDPFDVVLDLGCFHQLPPGGRAGYADNLRRLTAPGSRVLYIHRLRPARGDTMEQKRDGVQAAIGPDFALDSMRATETQAPDVEEVRPGVELRFVRVA